MKASIIAASVALVGGAAAFGHKGHGALHARHGDYKKEVCTVYTTVYETAPGMPSMAPNSTSIAPPAAPATSSVEVPVHTTAPAEPEELCSEEPYTFTWPAHSKPVEEAKPTPPAAVYPPAPPKEETSSAPAMVYPPVPPKETMAYPPAPPKETMVYLPAPPKEEETSKHAPAPVPSEMPKGKDAPGSKPSPPKPNPSKPKPPAKSTRSYGSGGRIVVNENKWSITYTPYAEDGQCKTQGEIQSDIKKISEMGFTTIRSYSTDCGVFDYVVPECEKYGLKIIYGIFLEGAGKGPFSDYANQQLEEIKDKAPKDGVAMVIVGNECVFNGNCEPSELGSYIDYVRTTLQSGGFPTDIAITTTEPVGTWEDHGAALCSHIDIFTVQVHPYFTQSVSADMAGDFAAQQLEQAAKVCPEAAAKGKFITEIGWPAQGNSNGMAVASPENQKIAIKSIQEKVGAEACLFSFQNDGWKNPGELGVEQFFGCAEALF